MIGGCADNDEIECCIVFIRYSFGNDEVKNGLIGVAGEGVGDPRIEDAKLFSGEERRMARSFGG
jgi:hypothetical protein